MDEPADEYDLTTPHADRQRAARELGRVQRDIALAALEGVLPSPEQSRRHALFSAGYEAAAARYESSRVALRAKEAARRTPAGVTPAAAAS